MEEVGVVLAEVKGRRRRRLGWGGKELLSLCGRRGFGMNESLYTQMFSLLPLSLSWTVH